MPAGVPGGTVMVPSGFNVNPPGTVTGVKVISPGTTGTPFKVSFTSTLGVFPPSNPLIGAGVSSTASIGATTSTVAVAVSQFTGEAPVSHNWYVMV